MADASIRTSREIILVRQLGVRVVVFVYGKHSADICSELRNGFG